MYTFWAVAKKNAEDEGVHHVLHSIQSGLKSSFENEVVLHRLTQNMLTVTAENGAFERALKKAKKASARMARGAFKKGQSIPVLELQIMKAGLPSTYATFVLTKVTVISVEDVSATPGKTQDNYSNVVLALKGKAESWHKPDYAKMQGEKAA